MSDVHNDEIILMYKIHHYDNNLSQSPPPRYPTPKPLAFWKFAIAFIVLFPAIPSAVPHE